MDLKRLADRAKGLIEKRGGTDSMKEDAAELKEIAQGPGGLTDKAKEAAEAIKEPGADEAVPPAAEAGASAERAGGEEQVEGAGRDRRRRAGKGRKRMRDRERRRGGRDGDPAV